ncbi:NUDIX hydrolase [Tepidibacillus fermentans]|uniref:NUDIX hydrolase n=1 Tax=Tepidibacillus fermentans TaxID=1281767 RepID=UPI001FB4E8C9|nr:8-oxo-dGTP diphosphatase [Tepidibacillus fermentans]
MKSVIEVKIVKRVTNCILQNGNQILMLQKPRRGWWVVPGGKVEPKESLQESVKREFYEETNLVLEDPQLRGIFSIIIEDNGVFVEEWMLFTYYASKFRGALKKDCEEGILEWKNINQILSLPKAKGDNIYFEHIFSSDQLITGKFIYTPDYDLISYHIDPLYQHKVVTV